MQDGNPVNWKAAAVPLAALTIALSAGIAYFAGGSSDDPQPPQGASAQFKFDSGPRYAPGSRQAAQTSQAGSSIDMFRQANANYSEATGQAQEAAPSARRPKDKKALQEFLQQARHDINMDPAAMAAEAAAAQGGGAQGRNIYNPVLKNGQQGGAQAAGAAVYSRQGAGAAARSGRLDSKRSSFSAGRPGASSLSGGSGGLRQGRGIGAAFGSDSAGGASQDTDRAFSSGGAQGGRSLEAGAYGSHGGGPSALSASGSQSDEGKRGGGEQQEKRVPAPVGFLWPRSFDFGDMYMYETAARQVILMNLGDAPLKVGKIENMDDETPFYPEKDKCSNTTLAPGKSCTFSVRFSPKAVRDYVTGFEIPSNDETAMNYQGVIEVKGNSKYSYSTWWWHHHWSGPAGYNNRLSFGLVPEGYTMEQVLRITNNTGSEWEEIKLDRAQLPASFKLSGDGCTGGSLGPHQSCAVTVTFAPTAADNRRFCQAGYGLYHAVDPASGNRSLSARPKFPPLVMEKPVEAALSGTLRVKANYNILHTGQVVAEIPVSAQSSAPFPVMGLARVQHYYFFK